MPTKLFNEQGDEIEALTADEVAELQSKALKADELEKAKSEWEVEKIKLEQEANPNWKQAREKIEKMEEALKAAGKQISEDGQIIDPAANNLTKEEITKLAQENAKQTLLEMEVEKRLNEFKDKDDRNLVEHYYKKLSAGEELTPSKIEQFMNDAIKAASPKQMETQKSFSGGSPVFDRNGEFSQTAKEMAAEFGLNEESIKQGGTVFIK